MCNILLKFSINTVLDFELFLLISKDRRTIIYMHLISTLIYFLSLNNNITKVNKEKPNDLHTYFAN